MAEIVFVHQPLDLHTLLILRPHGCVKGIRDAQRLLVLVLAAEIVGFLADAHVFQHNTVGRRIAKTPKRCKAMLSIEHRIRAVRPMTDDQHTQLRRIKVPHNARDIAHVQHALVFLRHNVCQRDQLNLLVNLSAGHVAMLVLRHRLQGSLCHHRFSCLCVRCFLLTQILRSTESARFLVRHGYSSLSVLSITVF